MKNQAILKPAIFQTFLAMCFLVVALLLGQKIVWVFDVGLWVIAFIAWLKYFKIRLLPKWVGFNFATITIGIFMFLVFTQLYPGAVVRTLDTVYAKPPYSDRKLKKIEVGNTTEQVRKLLGEPLYKRTIDYSHSILFTKGDYSLDLEFHSVGGGGSEPFLALWFSEEGEVNYVFNSDYSEIKDAELIGLNENRILERFGKPKRSLNIPTTIVWSYTKIAEGGSFGKNRSIYARRVYFNTSGRVVAVQMDKDTSYGIYKDIYKQSLNVY